MSELQYMNNPIVPVTGYLKGKYKVSEMKHVYRPSDNMKEFISKKLPPEPAFRAINLKSQMKSNFSVDKFDIIVKHAKEKAQKGEMVSDERLLTNLQYDKLLKAHIIRMTP